jgi:hypothetical protein
MLSLAETLMVNVLTRVKASPRFSGVKLDNIRRAHRTHVTRANCPAIHVIDGDEVPDKGKVGRGCAVPREKQFTVSLFVRDDDGYADADEIKQEVMARLSPAGGEWPTGVRLEYGPIKYESEVADGDALRVDMDFVFKFDTAAWRLDLGE